MDGRKRYENDKCGRKSFSKRSKSAPFSFERITRKEYKIISNLCRLPAAVNVMLKPSNFSKFLSELASLRNFAKVVDITFD